MIIMGAIVYILIAVAIEYLFSATGHTPVSFTVALLWGPALILLGLYRLASLLGIQFDSLEDGVDEVLLHVREEWRG